MNIIQNGLGPSPPCKKACKFVTIVGAGCAGLCAGFELKRAGFKVTILEASSRVGGRVITFRDPSFAPSLHAEGGAMRIPGDHWLLRRYLDDFGLADRLFPFVMENKVIYLLINEDPVLLALFPNLRDVERGRTVDELFHQAVQPVREVWNNAFLASGGIPIVPYNPHAVQAAYQAILQQYDQYSLRSYLTDVANWSEGAIRLYDLGNSHVVFGNGFIESFKDAFLSSNQGGGQAGMQQLRGGMDAIPKAFLEAHPDRGVPDPLINDIIYGARVTRISGTPGNPVTCYYDSPSGVEVPVESDYLIFAIPYTSQRIISKQRSFVPMLEMAIKDVRYVQVTKVLLQYRERWWRQQFENMGQGTDGGVVCDLPIRYTMFPREDPPFVNDHGVLMAAYTFEQDATILGAMSPERRTRLAARDLDAIFPRAHSLRLLEAAASQVFPADEFAGGSAFCYFGPRQKGRFLPVMYQSDWEQRVFFAGEHASYTHGWIQGALESAFRCVRQVYNAATGQ